MRHTHSQNAREVKKNSKGLIPEFMSNNNNFSKNLASKTLNDSTCKSVNLQPNINQKATKNLKIKVDPRINQMDDPKITTEK